MTSQNNTLASERGSALIVTILLVSVLLMTALILLQRIVPYAKSVRSMHEASLAYYLARGQVDLARHCFFHGCPSPAMASLQFPSIFGLLSQTLDYSNYYSTTSGSTTGRTSGSSGYCLTDTANVNQIDDDCAPYKEDEKAFVVGHQSGDGYVFISGSPQNPLQIKLHSTDASVKQFGTSKIDQGYHTLYSRSAGGLRFDLRGVNTTSIGQSTLRLNFLGTIGAANITLKMQYHRSASADVKTFTRNYTVANAGMLILNDTTPNGNIQSVDLNGKVTSSPSSLHDFLFENNCAAALICSLSLVLNSPIDQSIDFQFTSDTQIPDLNTVAIGDGFSGNGLYYQRIIDLIPTPQDI